MTKSENLNKEKSELKNEINLLKNKLKIMKSINTLEGFYLFFRKMIEKIKVLYDAFIYVNEMYFEYFGEYRFINFDSFVLCVQKKFGEIL